MRIVLAEDNPADVFLLREAFKEHNLEADIRWIDDGEEALRYFEQSGDKPDVDAILLDLSLPKVDGETILRYIRGDERYRDVPVAVLSSSDSPEERARVLALGAQCFIRKPTALAEFLKIGGVVRDLCGAFGTGAEVSHE